MPAVARAVVPSFHGEYRFLSNFWPSLIHVPLTWEGGMRVVAAETVEHAYQAAKTLDANEQDAVLRCRTPGDAKRAGRRVTIDPGWDRRRILVMHDLVREKFTAYDRLRTMLLATGDALLVEGNTWRDTFWGVCAGQGENHLGRILMRVRAEMGGHGE